MQAEGSGQNYKHSPCVLFLFFIKKILRQGLTV
jgi:hypothetical protein